ncbi:hypothetical protein ABTY20_25680 [Streptomyces sp. NPDC126497]|uniref:hypothetical protein n=1 Tax=Streptomyces sp. NPDC126497 TaxID=3155313 RepID=UPI0033191C62
MDLEKPAGPPAAVPAGEGCLVVAIRVPARIVALVLVVPVRLVWDALTVAGRFLDDRLLRPLGRALLWAGRAVFVWPFVGLWRYVLAPCGKGLARLGRVLVVLPAVAFHRHVLVPLGRGAAWLYARVLTPVGRVLAAIGAGARAGAARLGRCLVVVPSAWLYRWVFAPVGRAAVRCVRGLVRLVATVVAGVGTGLYRVTRVLLVLPALTVWHGVLVPVGRVLAVVAREAGDALGHAWRVAGHLSQTVGRFFGRLLRWVFVEPVRWVYRNVLTPVGHVVRDAVLRPVGNAAREVGRAGRRALAAARASVRRARADVRRALLGEPAGPKEPQLTHHREPSGPRARTLGSSTTALTKD